MNETDKAIEKNNNNKVNSNVSSNVLPYNDLHRDWISKRVGRNNYGNYNISLMSAFEYVDHIAIVMTSRNMYSQKVYCHYYDSMRKYIGKPYEATVFPDTVIYCAKRNGTKYVSLTKNPKDWQQYPVPLVDRTMKEPKHFFSVCIAPFYGNESKWLLISEYIEYYKLQGATYFFFYIAETLSLYDRMILDDYVRTGEIEVIVMNDRFHRPGKEWQMVQVNDCVLRNRHFSKWVAPIDIDERIEITKYKGNMADYLRNIKNDGIGTVQFRLRWVLKNESQPLKYKDEKETIKWMPTQRYTNSSSVGPRGRNAKCIIDPLKVAVMGVHYPNKFYPNFWKYELKPEEAILRHYRDIRFDNFVKEMLGNVLPKFGPFSITKLDSKFSKKLVDAVVKRVKFVYGKEQNKF